jgi:hypothetical protein
LLPPVTVLDVNVTVPVATFQIPYAAALLPPVTVLDVAVIVPVVLLYIA